MVRGVLQNSIMCSPLNIAAATTGRIDTTAGFVAIKLAAAQLKNIGPVLCGCDVGALIVVLAVVVLGQPSAARVGAILDIVTFADRRAGDSVAAVKFCGYSFDHVSPH